MNEFLLIALLGATSPVEPCCARPAPAFAVADDASKELKDQIGHFISPMVATTSVYGTARYFGAERNQARWIAGGIGIVLVVAKEVYDESVAGRFGLEETAIGFAGTAAGVYLGEKIKWE